jgi:hypothetical protein
MFILPYMSKYEARLNLASKLSAQRTGTARHWKYEVYDLSVHMYVCSEHLTVFLLMMVAMLDLSSHSELW